MVVMYANLKIINFLSEARVWNLPNMAVKKKATEANYAKY